MLLFIGLVICEPIATNAADVSLMPYNFGYYPLDDHKGMSINKGSTSNPSDYLFCVQRGYPFRSSVADIHICRATYDHQYQPDEELEGWWETEQLEGTMAEAIRESLKFEDLDNGGHSVYYFRGFGNWEINEDHTNAYFSSDQEGFNRPSTNKVAESFTMEGLGDYLSKESTENEKFDSLVYIQGLGYYESPGQYDASGELGPFEPRVLTGHEGAKQAYSVDMKQMTTSGIGLTASQVNALSMIGYYIFEDPDVADFSMTTRLQVSASLCWAVESGFVSSAGTDANNIQVIFKDSVGKTIYTYGMSCDEYIRKYIGNQYDAMKLYRQFVWKMNNLRTIPSFAYNNAPEAYLNPIHLKWDADENAYVATVSDANGVLKYFNFDVPGVSVAKNPDGTLYIRSENALSGALVSTPAKSTLLPDDCTFSTPLAWRWVLEGTSTQFDYTVLRWTDHHKHDWGCRWQCTTPRDQVEPGQCFGEVNDCEHLNCDGCEQGELTCSMSHEHTGDCYDWYCPHNHDASCHEHKLECTHAYKCPATENVTVYSKQGFPFYFENTMIGKEEDILSTCTVKFTPCKKVHYYTDYKTMDARYLDWQDLVSFELYSSNELVDPVYAYISVVTDPHIFNSETDVEIKLIDQWGNEADHVKVGEMYKVRYIYTYKGASKGFKINKTPMEKSYYHFYYISRMQAPNSTTKLYDLRGSANAYLTGLVPHSILYIEPTPVTIRGMYTTAETPYTLNGTYTVDSVNDWNDTIILDALTEDQWDSGYIKKSTAEIIASSTNVNPQKKSVTAEKTDGVLTVTWTYETEYEVFTSALINATAYIQVGENKNYSSSFFDEGFSYGDFDDHHYVGEEGYFASDQTGNAIDRHIIATKNSEFPSYAVKNKVWQSDIDIQVSNFIVNTGAGITEHNYSERGNATHPLNYNLYYTIDVENPKATIFENKVRSYNGIIEDNSNTQDIDTSGDVYEFDVNTFISWGASGSTINTSGAEGNVIVTDHIKTGTTYIQREIPVVLNTLTVNKAVMQMSIYPNHDRLVYEDYYSGVSMSGDATNRKVTMTIKSDYYPSNKQNASSDIFAAMDPNNKSMQPQNISGSNNVPNTNDSENRTHPGSTITAFNIMLSNGETKTVYDSHTKNYNQYNFTFNRDYRSNRVDFVSPRASTVFFKYSNTAYYYNGDVQSATGDFVSDGSSQTESYYISQVLFKSNYTSKYRKELEAQGAHYIDDNDANGNLLNGWIDMVNQNKFAIVAAGQGFELRVTVKYENSKLTQYLARYFGVDDAQNAFVGTSNNLGPQYCNISSMTGWASDGKSHAYINGFNTLDRLAVNFITGSNVYKDLFCFMSDNPDTVYSYSGIYGTPVIFEREISYSADYSVTTMTYTMCVSQQNGIASNLNSMKFFTNQLAPDKKSPGIVEGFYDVQSKGEHSITIWTPVFAATPFDYPNAIQDRYIGDAIELGYTIKTTGADDSIVHIVQ